MAGWCTAEDACSAIPSATWGIDHLAFARSFADEVLLLGGIEKARILKELRPHISFEDQLSHLESASRLFRCVHVPFGVANLAATSDAVNEALDEDARRRRVPPTLDSGKPASRRNPD